MKVTREDIPQIIEPYMKLEGSDKQQVEASPTPVGN